MNTRKAVDEIIENAELHNISNSTHYILINPIKAKDLLNRFIEENKNVTNFPELSKLLTYRGYSFHESVFCPIDTIQMVPYPVFELTH